MEYYGNELKITHKQHISTITSPARALVLNTPPRCRRRNCTLPVRRGGRPRGEPGGGAADGCLEERFLRPPTLHTILNQPVDHNQSILGSFLHVDVAWFFLLWINSNVMMMRPLLPASWLSSRSVPPRGRSTTWQCLFCYKCKKPGWVGQTLFCAARAFSVLLITIQSISTPFS